MRCFGIILGLFWLAFFTPAIAQSSQKPVCKNVNHCLDILDRHAEDEFDYDVLHEEFLRFGPKGKSALLKWLGSDSTKKIKRAQVLMRQGRFVFKKADQETIASLWPRGDIESHYDIMIENMSPVTRSAMISTLSHPDEKVRNFSRYFISEAVKNNVSTPLNPDEFKSLSGAIASKPTEAMVKLLSGYDIEQTRPVLQKTLRSTDSRSIARAYQMLYDDNPENAFESLLAVLKTTKNPKTARAISFVLRERHRNREDGFYLRFARDIAEDETLNHIGRFAGFDAVMASKESDNAPEFKDLEKLIPILQLALDDYFVTPDAKWEPGYLTGEYYENLYRRFPAQTNDWEEMIWQRLQGKPTHQKLKFIQILAISETKTSETILMEALHEKRDWRIPTAAARIIGIREIESARNILMNLRAHPIEKVREAVYDSLNALGKNDGELVEHLVQPLEGHCPITPYDFKGDVKNFPYFDLSDVNMLRMFRTRRTLTSVAPTRDGWIAAFGAGEWGGDLRYFDNRSGNNETLLDDIFAEHRNYSVGAIIPVKSVPLGEYAKAFWVFFYDGGFMDNGVIYHLKQTEGVFEMTMVSQLPHRFFDLEKRDNDDVLIVFKNLPPSNQTLNPPLRLNSQGQISRACQAPDATSNTLN